MSRPENPPAFPIASEHLGHCQGMSLRDWFAGMALMGICSNPDMSGNNAATASVAYHVADAMLEERAKGNW